MTPQIFPGLKPPTSQLFFDLQAFIAENGGRLRLAEKLEADSMKSARANKYTVRADNSSWTQAETNFIINNYKELSALSISEILDKPLTAVRWHIWTLTESGQLNLKLPSK